MALFIEFSLEAPRLVCVPFPIISHPHAIRKCRSPIAHRVTKEGETRVLQKKRATSVSSITSVVLVAIHSSHLKIPICVPPLSLDSAFKLSVGRVFDDKSFTFSDVRASLRIPPLYPKLLSFHRSPFRSCTTTSGCAPLRNPNHGSQQPSSAASPGSHHPSSPAWEMNRPGPGRQSSPTHSRPPAYPSSSIGQQRAAYSPWQL